MYKYGRIQKKISPRLVCDSHGACLDCMLPGVQVTARLGFFCVQVVYSDSEDSGFPRCRGAAQKGAVPHHRTMALFKCKSFTVKTSLDGIRESIVQRMFLRLRHTHYPEGEWGYISKTALQHECNTS